MPEISTNLFKKIRRIQYNTTRLANNLLAGNYRSAFKGRGMEFEEVREYQPGDEVRSIDWNVTARMGRPYIKSFTEEREITMTLVVDISASTRFGSSKELKSDLIAEIAAMLAFAAIKNNDKVALILFSDRVEKYYPPGKGTRHVLRIIRELLTYKPIGHSTDVDAALAFLGKLQQHGGICFVISDFICPDFTRQASLLARRHDLVYIALTDTAEKRFPNMGLVCLNDAETGTELLIDTRSKTFQNSLERQTCNRNAYYQTALRKIGSDFCQIETDRPFYTQLKKFFILRQLRRR